MADAEDGEGGEAKRPPRVSQTAWLVAHGDAVLEAVSARAASMLRLPRDVAAASERLQVLRYEPGRACRYCSPCSRSYLLSSLISHLSSPPPSISSFAPLSS